MKFSFLATKSVSQFSSRRVAARPSAETLTARMPSLALRSAFLLRVATPLMRRI
jgi:hypothetical protein